MLETLIAAGSLFSLLTFNHFVVDWGFQTHNEAMNKSHDWKWRARHCLIYAIGFIPLLMLMELNALELLASFLILFTSHFIEDTYIPVYFWAKYIRRMPMIRLDGIQAFKAEFSRPLGLILFITIDQLIHMLFLLPLVYFALV